MIAFCLKITYGKGKNVCFCGFINIQMAVDSLNFIADIKASEIGIERVILK